MENKNQITILKYDEGVEKSKVYGDIFGLCITALTLTPPKQRLPLCIGVSIGAIFGILVWESLKE